MVTVCYIFWMSVEMDTISQRMCNWGDNGWMIGTGRKQFFCQGYKAWLRKLPTLTDPWRIALQPWRLLFAGVAISGDASHIISQNETEKSSGAHTWIPAINRILFSHRHKSTCCTGRSPMIVCFMWYFEAMMFIKTVAGLWNQKERHTQKWPSSLRLC